MAGSNEFAFFAAEAYVSALPGEGSESGRKNFESALRPVPVRKSTFPESQ